MSQSQGDYRFTPGTRRRHLLFGLREALLKLGTGSDSDASIFVVEGFIDVLALAAANAPVVGAMSNQLTLEQTVLLSRYARSVTLFPDHDKPGPQGMAASLPLLLSQGLAVAHVLPPPGEDPASFLRNEGAQALSRLEPHDTLLEFLTPAVAHTVSPAESAKRMSDALRLLRARRSSPAIESRSNVSADVGTTELAACGSLGRVWGPSFDSLVRAAIIPQLPRFGVGPSAFPLFLLLNTLTDFPNVTAAGYHSRVSVGGQTYGVALFDSSGTISPDVSILSHEIAEWYDDPYLNNLTPPWGHIGQVGGGCQNNLEVGDPPHRNSLAAHPDGQRILLSPSRNGLHILVLPPYAFHRYQRLVLILWRTL
jgi:hypothetical protein